jgi:hypothetical protein
MTGSGTFKSILPKTTGVEPMAMVGKGEGRGWGMPSTGIMNDLIEGLAPLTGFSLIYKELGGLAVILSVQVRGRQDYLDRANERAVDTAQNHTAECVTHTRMDSANKVHDVKVNLSSVGNFACETIKLQRVPLIFGFCSSHCIGFAARVCERAVVLIHIEML